MFSKREGHIGEVEERGRTGRGKEREEAETSKKNVKRPHDGSNKEMRDGEGNSVELGREKG